MNFRSHVLPRANVRSRQGVDGVHEDNEQVEIFRLVGRVHGVHSVHFAVCDEWEVANQKCDGAFACYNSESRILKFQTFFRIFLSGLPERFNWN